MTIVRLEMELKSENDAKEWMGLSILFLELNAEVKLRLSLMRFFCACCIFQNRIYSAKLVLVAFLVGNRNRKDIDDEEGMWCWFRKNAYARFRLSLMIMLCFLELSSNLNLWLRFTSTKMIVSKNVSEKEGIRCQFWRIAVFGLKKKCPVFSRKNAGFRLSLTLLLCDWYLSSSSNTPNEDLREGNDRSEKNEDVELWIIICYWDCNHNRKSTEPSSSPTGSNFFGCVMICNLNDEVDSCVNILPRFWRWTFPQSLSRFPHWPLRKKSRTGMRKYISTNMNWQENRLQRKSKRTSNIQQRPPIGSKTERKKQS